MSRGVKLTISEQIQHMKKLGITFIFESEENATKYLEDNNNYFKLRAYRKNYAKNGEEKYVGLDFACLRDIAIIDMRLRYTLLEMCLDIEHATRVKLIKTIVDSDSEDGYSVVSDYKAKIGEKYCEIIRQASRSPYCKDLQEKYRDNMPIWALVEMMQFGELCAFFGFVAERLNDRKMRQDFYLLQEIRQIRNACAHSNCVLNDLKSDTSPSHRINSVVNNELSRIESISSGVRKRKTSNSRIRQITTLLYYYRVCVKSTGLRERRSKQLYEVFVRRFGEHREYYEKSDTILSTFDYFKKIIDKWYPVDV